MMPLTPLARRMRASGSCTLINNATLMAHARAVVQQLKHIPVCETLRHRPQYHQVVVGVIRYTRLVVADLGIEPLCAFWTGAFWPIDPPRHGLRTSPHVWTMRMDCYG